MVIKYSLQDSILVLNQKKKKASPIQKKIYY